MTPKAPVTPVAPAPGECRRVPWWISGAPSGFQFGRGLNPLVEGTYGGGPDVDSDATGRWAVVADKAAPPRLLATGWIERIMAGASRLEQSCLGVMAASPPLAFKS